MQVNRRFLKRMKIYVLNNFWSISFAKLRMASRNRKCYIIGRKSKTSAQVESSGPEC